MSKEQIIYAFDNIGHYLENILADESLFIDNRLCEDAKNVWSTVGKEKLSKLKEYFSNPKVVQEVERSEITDEFLKFKVSVIDFLSEKLKVYARRILDCINTFLSSLACIVSDPTIKVAIEILKEILSFIKNILK